MSDLIVGHWYERGCGCVGQWNGDGRTRPCDCEPTGIIPRDLTIGPDNPITAEDVGRHACGPGEPHAMIRDNRGSGFPDAPFAGCVGCAPDGTTVAPAWAKGRGRVPYLTRFLSARECRDRGIAATHPSQRYEPAREGEPDTRGADIRPKWAETDTSPPASDFERLADDDKVKPLSPSQCDMRGMGERLQRCMHYREPKPKRPLSREQRYQLALEVLCGWQEVR